MSLIEKSREMYLTFAGHARKHQEEADAIRANNPPSNWPENNRLVDKQVAQHLNSVRRWQAKMAELRSDGTGNLLVDPSSEEPDELLMHFEHSHACYMADMAHAKRVTYVAPFGPARSAELGLGRGVT